MVRVRPFRRIQVDEEICKKLDLIKQELRYRGSFTSFLEGILDQYADGLFRGAETKDIHTTRVRRVTASEQRKTA